MKKPNDEKILIEALQVGEDLDGFRMLDFEESGVYLSVHPPSGEGKPVEAGSMLRELTNLQIVGLDEEIVKQAVLYKSGERIRIAPPQEVIKRDGSVRIEVSKNKMKAWLTVFPPFGGRAMNLNDCYQVLAEAGVTFGIMEVKIKNALNMEQESESILVAEGLEPVDGTDAVLEYNFKYNKDKLIPKELEDGNVDFYNLEFITNVRSGDILATKTSSTEGTPGNTIFNEIIPPKNGKDKILVKGQNTDLINEGSALQAKADGHVVIKGKAIHVLPIYEHRGDVDFASGNLDFVGSIIVRGTVKTGFTVKAGGDVEIFDIVEGGNIYAGGCIQVKKGVQGQGKGYIQAEGDIITKYIENANVSSSENVYAEAIMHSNVVAKKKVIVSGKKGLIVGGSCCAGESVQAKVIGSSLATSTLIEVGISPQLRKEYNEVEKKLEDTRKNLEKTGKAFNLLKKMETSSHGLSDEKKVMLIKIVKTRQQLFHLNESGEEKKIYIEKTIKELQRGRVEVSGLIYPGVAVYIGRSVLNINDEIRGVFLVEEAGEVRIASV